MIKNAVFTYVLLFFFHTSFSQITASQTIIAPGSNVTFTLNVGGPAKLNYTNWYVNGKFVIQTFNSYTYAPLNGDVISAEYNSSLRTSSGYVYTTTMPANNTITITYALPPTLSSLTPLNGIKGDTIILTGTNLTSTNQVKIGDSSALSFYIINDNSIGVIVGNGVAGPAKIVVVTNGGSATITGFTYQITSTNNYNPFVDTLKVTSEFIELDAGEKFSKYRWNTGDSTRKLKVTRRGWYKVTVWNSIGLSSSDSTYISLINAFITNNDTSICRGSEIELFVTSKGSVSDIDGNIYDTYEFGRQAWILRNLNVSRYRNGNIIPIGPRCWYNNDTTLRNIYGSLYDWPTVVDNRGIAPLGFHVPKNEEWTELVNFFGGMNVAGNAFKNQSLFKALMGGYRTLNGSYVYLGAMGCWSSATVGNGQASMISYAGSSNVAWGGVPTSIAFSVRCVNDIDSTKPISPLKYLWSTGDTTQFIKVSPSATTTYYVTITDGVITSKDSINIIVRQNTISTIDITACNNYLWNGTNYTTSGTYTYKTTNSVGCDSTATLNLIIRRSSTSTTNISICNAYNWNGVSYTTSGVYTYKTINSEGCDSIATLNLVIKRSSTSISTITACNSYNWNGVSYTTSGTYTFNTINSVGCDSTATLNLTIRASSASTTNITACDSYFWNGLNYTSSGTYTFKTTNSVACDSIATLNLNIKRSTSSSQNISVCNSFFWNGTNYTNSGTYVYRTTNSIGCDSIVTLNLIIKKSSTSSTNISACSSYFWNGTTYFNSGTYNFNTTNAAGCDSVAVLNLTINPLPQGVLSTTGPFCISGNPLLTFVSSSGTGPFSIIYNNGISNIVKSGVNNGSAFTPSISTISQTTKYNLISITDIKGCTRNSDIAGNLAVAIVNQPSSSTTSIFSCTPYVWNGNTYSSSGTFYANFTNVSGCDSTAILNLHITKPITKTFELKGCNRVVYNGIEYLNPTLVQDTIRTSFGCDSIYNFVTIQTNCDGFLEIVSDSIVNYFGDTIQVAVRIKEGKDVYSTYAYLSFDGTYLSYAGSSMGSYLGNNVITQNPIITGNQINFGMTKSGNQQGSNGDGLIYNFKFTRKSPLPSNILFNPTNPSFYKLIFNLSNISVYNRSGVQPTSFNNFSITSDTTLYSYYVPVWPGDLNNDKIVNVADLLPIGYFYGSTGTPRPNGNLFWAAQPSPLWGFDILSSNSSGFKCFADGNADGKIDLADQVSIGFNLSRIHYRRSSSQIKYRFNSNSNIPAITINIPDSLLLANQLPSIQNVSVKIGSEEYPINNLYGVAFDVYFDPSFVDISKISTDYGNSVFGKLGEDYIKIEDMSNAINGKISIALTRFNNSGILCKGAQLLNINFPIVKTTGEWFKIAAIPLSANDITGNRLSVTGSSDSVKFKMDNITSTSNIESDDISIKVFPNPFRNKLQIQYQLPISQKVSIQIFDVHGRCIKAWPFTYKKSGLNQQIWDLNEGNETILTSGTYICRITTSIGHFNKIIIME